MSVGLTYGELARVLSENTLNAGGSVVEQAGENITIRAVGRVHTTEEIANLPRKFGARRRGRLPQEARRGVAVGGGRSAAREASIE